MEKLIELLEDIQPGPDYANSTALIDNHELSSFSVVSLVAELEDAYGITIPAVEVVAENFNSARAMLDMIERLKKA